MGQPLALILVWPRNIICSPIYPRTAILNRLWAPHPCYIDPTSPCCLTLSYLSLPNLRHYHKIPRSRLTMTVNLRMTPGMESRTMKALSMLPMLDHFIAVFSAPSLSLVANLRQTLILLPRRVLFYAPRRWDTTRLCSANSKTIWWARNFERTKCWGTTTG